MRFLKLSKLLFRILLLIVALITCIGMLIFCKDYYYKTAYPLKYTNIVEEVAKEYDLDKYLLYSVIKTESNFKFEAESSVGARGLMQITGDTFDWIKMKLQYPEETKFEDMYFPEENIVFGGYLLNSLLEEFDDIDSALAAYHAGRSCVNGWLSSIEYSVDGKTLHYIPYDDTRAYVKTVAQAYSIYKKLYK